MFDRGANDPAPPAARRGSRAKNREIVRLRTAAGKDDSSHRGFHQTRHALAGLLEYSPRTLTRLMHRGGVAMLLAQKPCDCLALRRPDGRPGVMIEINVHRQFDS